MLIRRITADDTIALRDVRLRALQDSPLAFGSTFASEAARALASWESWAFEHGSGEEMATFLALRDSVPVGIATGKRSDVPVHFNLFSMWIDPSERRRGVGRGLVEAVVAWATASRGARIALWVTQEGARAFYERLGFVDDGRRMPLSHSPNVIEVGMTRQL